MPEDVAAAPATDCPGVGHAARLPCSEAEVKLLSFAFYRRIGDKTMAEAKDGQVFALAEIEWVRGSSSAQPTAAPTARKDAHEPGPATAPTAAWSGTDLRLLDGDGREWQRVPDAETAFLAMQPPGRFMAPPSKPTEPLRDVRVFSIPPIAATAGLFLDLAAPPCADKARFCLGKHVVK